MNSTSKFLLPLDQRESARLYWELSLQGAPSTGKRYPWRYKQLSEETLLTLAILQARYDPRLMEILVEFFRTPKTTINPIRFKEMLREAEALPIAAVIGEFVIESTVSVQVKEFFRFLVTGVSSVQTQLFYRGIYPIGGRKMEEATTKPLWAFKKWGFLASDPPLLKEYLLIARPYLYDETSRIHILKEFSARAKRFRLRDYLKEIHESVSRQQALKDVRTAPWLRKVGKGKGTFYETKKPPPA